MMNNQWKCPRAGVILAGVILAGVILAGGLPVLAGPSYEFTIDNVHSSVTFKVKHNNIHHAYGRLNEISGVVTTDSRKSPKKVTISATVQADSVDTANKGRDKHLKSEDFFNTKKYKEITFTTKECKQTSDSHFELSGEMTFLGQTKPLTVTFELMGIEKGKSEYVLGGESTFVVKCSDYGMPVHEGLGDEVTVTVSLYALQKVEPAG